MYYNQSRSAEIQIMLLSIDGLISVIAAFVNLITIASFLDMDTTTTKLYTKIPLVKLVFLFTFAYSVIPQKVPCLMAVALFFVIEVQNFVRDALKRDDDGDDES